MKPAIDSSGIAGLIGAAEVQKGTPEEAEIIAEGVETQAELDTLLALGIAKAQGYFFGKPMSLSAALELGESMAARTVAASRSSS